VSPFCLSADILRGRRSTGIPEGTRKRGIVHDIIAVLALLGMSTVIGRSTPPCTP
jgi:hypothetical protein